MSQRARIRPVFESMTESINLGLVGKHNAEPGQGLVREVWAESNAP